MQIIVCGGRKYVGHGAREHVYSVLDDVHKDIPITLLIQGGAPGADSLAKQWADSRGVKCHQEDADWNRYGNSAGPIRNAKMLKDFPAIMLVIAFPGGPGTKNMREQAEKKHIEVIHFVEKRKKVK